MFFLGQIIYRLMADPGILGGGAYLPTFFEGKAVGWRATQSHASLGGSGGMPPRKIFKKMKQNGAISCILRPCIL